VPDRRRAWARALGEAAPSSERRKAYADALDGIALAMSEDRRVVDYLHDPAIPKSDKKEFLASALGGTDAVFSRFCELLVDKERSSLIPALASVFRRIVDEEEGVARLEIEAAREPDAATVGRIGEAWSKSAGVRTTISTLRIKPELIAGYRLRSGSIRIDYSIAGRLERLRRRLVLPLGLSSGRSGEGKDDIHASTT
jgi:F-type H+-transporting ATPase subunit delta